MVNRKIKVAVVFSDIAPLRIPFLNKLASIPHLDMTVFYHDERRPGHNWVARFKNAKFLYRRLSCIKFYFHTRAGDAWPRHLPVGLFRALVRGGFDIIVCLNWTEFYTLFCLCYGKLTRTPVVLWEDSISHPPSWLKRCLSPEIRKMFSAYDAMVAMSSRCKEYLIEWGAKPQSVFLSTYAIGDDLFPKKPCELSLIREKINSRLGLSDKKVILFVGQFIRRKGIVELLTAFRKVAAGQDDVLLLMVGDGPMRLQIEAFAIENGLRNRIVLPGYVQQNDLPGFYARSDVFVLPSYYETFGAAIGEAVAQGLPIITTQMVGATPDIIRDRINGIVIPPADAEALYHALDELLRNKSIRQEMAEASRKIDAERTIDKAVSGFIQAIEYCMDSKIKRNRGNS